MSVEADVETRLKVLEVRNRRLRLATFGLLLLALATGVALFWVATRQTIRVRRLEVTDGSGHIVATLTREYASTCLSIGGPFGPSNASLCADGIGGDLSLKDNNGASAGLSSGGSFGSVLSIWQGGKVAIAAQAVNEGDAHIGIGAPGYQSIQLSSRGGHASIKVLDKNGKVLWTAPK